MPLPIIPIAAFGAAYLLIKKDADTASAPVIDTDTSVPQVDIDQVAMIIDWSIYIERYRGDLPHGLLSRWIEKESDGNPCAVGVWGGPWEAGIGQVWFEKEQRNEIVNGVTLDQLREACESGGSQKVKNPLTERQRIYQIESLVNMANEARRITLAKLRALNIAELWTEDDQMCMVKLWHALPVLCTNHLSVASQDGKTDSWDSYRSYMESMDRDELVNFDKRAGYSGGRGAAPFFPIARLFQNAEYCGRGT